jgi:thiol-disulfide isomerase/thioredoxin
VTRYRPAPFLHFGLAAALLLVPQIAGAQEPGKPLPPAASKTEKQSAQKGQQAKPPSEQQELQTAIDDAGNDRAALARNLEAFLKKYPESSQRAQIYRALVEATLQLRDYPRATEYAERLVALRPDDTSITVLAIQLLDKYGDSSGWRRAITYCSRVIEQVGGMSATEKSPRVSNEDWETEKKHDKAALLLVRGRLYQKLNDMPNAQKDLEASYALEPTAAAAEKLGELAELRKDPNTAIREYAIAFAWADGTKGTASRRDLRNKIGNAWRLAHGSEDGLGEYLLHAFDDTAAVAKAAKPARNAGLKNPYEFTLRKAPDGSPFPFADTKGKVVVLNFWATWCGPCREMEPHFEKVAAHFAGQKDIVFLGLNCDDDETLVGPYLEEEKPKTGVLFADGMEQLLAVHSFPTTLILDRTGTIAFRTDGFDPDTVDKVLVEAVERVAHLPDATPAAAAATP